MVGENSNIKIHNAKKRISQLFLDCIKKDWLTSLIIVASFLLYMVVIVPSGSTYCFDARCGVYFWGAHTHDGIWHLALIESSFNTVPFKFPVYAGYTLSGYNYLLDGVLFVLTHLGVSSSFLYFKIQSIVWFAVFVWLLYEFSRRVIRKTTSFRYIAFFALFTSSFGFIIQWVNHKSFMGSSGVPTMQGPLGMTNPQFMWSLCVLLAVWILLETKNRTWWLLPILTFTALGLKFYVLIPLSILVLFYTTRSLLFKEYVRSALIVVGYLGGIVLAYFLFYYTGSGVGGLVWQPLSIPHQMVEDPNMWHMPELVRQRYFLLETGNLFSPRLWWVEIQTLFYFIVFNYGIRIVAIFLAPLLLLFVPSFRKYWREILIMCGIVIVTTTASVLFIQKGIWWNSIQFLYYGLFAGSLLTAIVFDSMVSKIHPILRIVLLLAVFTLCVPSIVDIMNTFGTKRGALYISKSQIQSLQHLAQLPDGVVLTDPFLRREGNMLSQMYDTAHISAYSGKQLYMGDETQLQLLGIPYQARKKVLIENPCKVLKDTHIRYVYLDGADTSQPLYTCVAHNNTFIRVYDRDGYHIWARK